MVTPSMSEIEFHPASNEFPLLSEERLAELAEDLQANGQREPIRIYEGRIVDGRNRYLACRKAGLEPRFEPLPENMNPFAYVWSLNGQRRDLTQDQRYLIWKSCVDRSGEWETQRKRIQEEANRARANATASQPRNDGGTFSEVTGPSTICGRTREKPRGQGSSAKADASGTNRGAVERMDRLERERPDLAEQVKTGEITTAEAMRQIARPHVANNSGDNEWYTPSDYIERAAAVMGGIDLDPASSAEANRVVGAERYYTAEDDGLSRDWQGRVWINPPYAQPLIQQFCAALVRHYRNGHVQQAVVLVNNATETRWFQLLLAEASAICFPAGRVRYWKPGKKTATPLQGQAVLYFGQNVGDFGQQFKALGSICHVA